MARLFRREKRQREANIEPENRHDDRLYASMVPASARSPETQRFTPPGDIDSDPDAPDQDLEFLATLAREVDRAPKATPRFQAPPDDAFKTVALPTEAEKLNVFREMQDIRSIPDRDVISERVEHVDMDDLLETLSTTAAALRLRKAA